MVDGNVAVEPGLQAQLEAPEEPADKPHADFSPSIGLRVVRDWAFRLYILDILVLSQHADDPVLK